MPLATTTQRSNKKKRIAERIPSHIVVTRKQGITSYRCSICNPRRGFRTKAHIKYHNLCSDPQAKRPFNCHSCSRGFNIKTHYEYHMRSVHSGDRRFVCEDCGKKFILKGKLKRHMKIHPRQKSHNYQTRSKTFASEKSTKSHEQVLKKEKPYSNNCGQTFSGKTSLKKHLISHIDENLRKGLRQQRTTTPRPKILSIELRPACDECSKTFGTKWALKEHKKIHKGERLFICTSCKTAFMRKYHMERHCRTKACRLTVQPTGLNNS